MGREGKSQTSTRGVFRLAPVLFLLATQLVLSLNSIPDTLKKIRDTNNDKISDSLRNSSREVSEASENYVQIEKSTVLESTFPRKNNISKQFETSLITTTKNTTTPEIKLHEFISVERSINSSTINNLTKLFPSKYKNENIPTKDLNLSLTQTTLNPHYFQNIATYNSFNHHFKPFTPTKKSLNFTNLIENSSSAINNIAKLGNTINFPSVTPNNRLNKIGLEKSDPFQGEHLNYTNANYTKNDNGSDSVGQNKTNKNYFKLTVTKLLNSLKLGNEKPQRLEVATTTSSYNCCAINTRRLSKTEDAYRQQNRSIFLKLIGNGLRLKPAVIKRAHSLTANQSSLSVEDVLNDAPELFNIGLKRLHETTNSHGILYHEKESSDSYPNPTQHIYRTNNEIHENTSEATVASSYNEDFIANRKEPTSYTTRAFKIKSDSINLNGVSATTEYYPAKEENPTKAQLPKRFAVSYNLSTNCLNCSNTFNATLNKSSIDSFDKNRKVLENDFYPSNFSNSNLSYTTLNSDLTTIDGISPRSSVLSTSENESEFEKFRVGGVQNNYTDLGIYNGILITTSASDKIPSAINLGVNNSNALNRSSGGYLKVISEFPWPVKKEAVVEGDLVLGGLMMVHEREDTVTCGPVMPQGGIQALEAMLYTLDRLNEAPTPILPNITLGAHILDDCDKDTYGLEMAVDFIKEGTERINASEEFKQKKIIDTQSATIMKHHIRHRPDLNGQEIYWPVKKEALVEGNLVLGGLMMVHEREDSVTCGPIMPQGGIQALEAMLYTLDRINNPLKTFLPNITIGAHILDDCDKDTYGLEMAVDFIKGSISNIDGAEYHCNKTQVRKVISGVVGAASSVTSIQVANLLRLFKIPQVSFFSTSPELSNKQRFEYFTRTIPSDHYQVKAMVDIVRLMGWSYISIIYEESNYGIKAFEELEDLLADYNICIAVKEKLVKDSGVADESAYDNIVQKLLTKPRARGTIIFGSDQEVAGVMRAVKRSNATGSFSWIGSDGWSARSLVSDGNEAEVEGTLSVQPQANPVQGFEEYFLSLNVENNRRNPWFVEFWEDHFQCRYPNSTLTPYNQKYTHLCTGKEKLTRQNTVFENQLQFVSDAVMAFAYAIKDMHLNLCGNRSGLCDAMIPTKGPDLLKYLRTVNFVGLSGDQFHFDANGDGPARYNIIHFKQVSPGKYRWVRVGEYVEGELLLNMSDIQFKYGHSKAPTSDCSSPCDLGQAKKYVEGESCCWHCFNCTQYQIRHSTDPTQCIGCPLGTVPDPLHIRCLDIPEEYLRPESGWAIGAMALSSSGILITSFVVCVFIRFNDTPIVRASGRELSYVLLAGILMCYCVTFALVIRPTDIVCGIQRFCAGFCFTVVYAALLTKTNRISRIFNAGKQSAKRPSLISPRSQLMICSAFIGVQVLINGVWMVIYPARAIHHYPTREDNLLVCSTDIDASYMIAFTYPILLIIVCTIYAVLTRKIPEAFNESKHIGFTMYTTCVIWLAFVPLYFGTANHVALRITSMSVTISLSASVTVACLFSPKLYIILIRPERNVRQSMMPMRYSAINKSSGTAGSGSMMAPIMLTAATFDQKQQIQKHIPPIQRDMSQNGEEANGVKPKMVDSSTLTDPALPSYDESVGNSEDFVPKINNNHSVGNGPLAILPGIQIKELPL